MFKCHNDPCEPLDFLDLTLGLSLSHLIVSDTSMAI